MCDILKANKEKENEMWHGNEGETREEKKDSKVIRKKRQGVEMSCSLLPPDAGLPAGLDWGCMYVESADREEK